jgi:hypothetical protein
MSVESEDRFFRSVSRGLWVIVAVVLLAVVVGTVLDGKWWFFPSFIGGLVGFFALAYGLGRLIEKVKR